MIKTLKDIQQLLIQETKTDFQRFLLKKINFKLRLIGIVGQRGVGKTTLILQYLKQISHKHRNFLYLSADNTFLKEGDLLQLAWDFYFNEGGRLLCIDEIHRYQNWNQELKNIYDTFPDLRVIFSGSSSIDLVKGKYDLSRRAFLYHLPGLSFREFLLYHKGIKHAPITLQSLLKDPQKNVQQFGSKHILMHFKEYLQQGYYPFGLETNDRILFYQQVSSLIDKAIHEDIASFYKLKTGNLNTFKEILSFLALTSPGTVNVHKLSNSLKKNNSTVAHYLDILQEASLIRYLTNDRYGHAFIRNAKKVFLENPNMFYALSSLLGKPENVGTIRELFMLNQLENAGYIPLYSQKGDLTVKNTTFEVGGKNKTWGKFEKKKNNYLVLDDILVGEKNIIPLYLFGFLY
jgi:uncharacterized protein